MRKEILVPGLGWISSGIVSIAVWYVHPVTSHLLLYIGVLTIAVGISLLVSSKRLSAIIDEYKKTKK
ncbi:MAG: hypothetical protein KGI06_00865 [Candidatus Micrarchaeota archaeon]|nr:hypothetical protein [Candidatus Micrarchaeota archaeon]